MYINIKYNSKNNLFLHASALIFFFALNPFSLFLSLRVV